MCVTRGRSTFMQSMAWAIVRKTDAVIWLGFLFSSLIKASNDPERWEMRLKPVIPDRLARGRRKPPNPSEDAIDRSCSCS